MENSVGYHGFSPDTKKDKVILTGGTEGVGRAIALELVNDNHELVICARTKERLDEMKGLGNMEAVQIDLGQTEEIGDFIKKGVEKMNGITTLILNASVTGIRESVDYTKKVVRDAQIELIDQASEALRQTNGRIVFLTSRQAKNFIEGHEHYGQAKKDVEDYLKEFSEREENKNIIIILIEPGHVDTRMNQEAINYGIPAVKDRSINAKNLGKFRDPKIVGKIISKISLGRNKFNPKSEDYDIPVANNETVSISDDNYNYEFNNNL